MLIANDDGIDGTPAACVALGVNQWDDVDLVLSGINMQLEPWAVRAPETILERDEPFLAIVIFPLRPRGMSWTRRAVDRYDGMDHAALAVSAEAAAR